MFMSSGAWGTMLRSLSDRQRNHIFITSINEAEYKAPSLIIL